MTGDGPEEGGGFVARWSRRKRGAAGAVEPDAAAPPADPAPDPAPAAPELTEAEWLAANGLPDPDSLARGDDFTAFLRPGVPALLRRRALRRLWTSNPVLANLDGLVDHGEDYTDAARVPEAMRTAYQVGRGMLRRIAETAETGGEGEAPSDARPATAPAVAQAPDAAEEAPVAVDAAGADAASDPPAATAEPGDPETDPPFRPRRMTFRT